MFKIICEIDKLKLEEHQIIVVKYKNCQPCEFNDYQMFDDHHNIQERLIKATVVVQMLETAALDINKPEYRNLANKIYYLDDLTDYRYITLFDESTEAENVFNIFGVPWIYSAIIRHITPDTSSALFNNAWESVYSWFSNPQPKEEPEKENFKTIWEKHFLFSLPPTIIHDRLPGTLQKSDYSDDTGKQYYAIDDYFLKHLLFDKQNSKCIPLNNKLEISGGEDVAPSTSDTIYKEYKSHLPKLVGLKYLEVLSKLRSCYKAGKTTKSSDETIVLSDETDRFALNSASKIETFQVYTLVQVCDKLGGILIPLAFVAEKAKEQCAALVSKQLASTTDDLKLVYSNELYSFNCYTINETLAALGNIEDIYTY